MLRINQSTDIGHAKHYFSTADYYSEGQELTGRWRGEAVRRLGLHGEIKQADWEALCENRDPHSDDRLTRYSRDGRTVGYDFNFHVPKSVSLLYATTRDERILDAFRDAVDGTMHDMEAEMQARVRKGNKDENRRTGNLAWGEYIHFTSRPVDGVPDPQLHAHCYVFNVTFDEHENTWKAGQFRELKRDAPYFEAVFHSRFAHRLSDLGLPIERTKTGWELSGVDRGLIDKFSRRTKQIEEKARELGIDSAEAKDELGAKTREKKQKDIPFPELQAIWHERMTSAERQAIQSLEQKLGGDAEPADANASARAVEFAKSHVFERKSVVPERTLLAAALKHSVGRATVEQIHDQADRSEFIIGTRQGRRMVTTREVLDEERRMIEFAREGRGTCQPFVRQHEDFTREWLNEAQKKAIKHVVESRDRVMVVRGAAGVGKTTLLQEAREAIEAGGTKVLAFAPSTTASRVALREAGFAEADTLQSLLVNQKLQEEARGQQLLLIDEAGQVSTKTMTELFELADRLDARVLLVGDRYQHGSVERGAALRLLEEEAGIVPAQVKEIQRQRDKYKEAVKALADGRTADGFRRLDDLGWIKEIPTTDRYKQLAANYVETLGQGKTALVVSPTHAEGDRITAEIRGDMQAQGQLDANERSVRVLTNANLTEAERGDAVNYAPGDVLVFHQNAPGFTRGDRVAVSAAKQLPLDQAGRFQVFHAGPLKLAAGDLVRITRNGVSADGKHRLNNGAIYNVKTFDEAGNIVLENGWTVSKDFGHLAHGYVVTSHASQGRTVDRVFVGQSGESFAASSREQFYVSASRAREQVVVYTDDKAALLDAVSRTDERLTATEFVGGIPQQVFAADREREAARLAERSSREREELTYER